MLSPEFHFQFNHGKVSFHGYVIESLSDRMPQVWFSSAIHFFEKVNL
ncbi:hypothetical protein GGQ71_000156 [Rhizobium taibaishanense]|uniref:Uncharacterized protein n=1 Tax=Allorhizobium taibaishanense TaxID=887144 RepID=A0A7W6HIL9_9HYPH|nr:hypothetical protein [Allorhizobium taibaishanense]